MLGIAHVGFVAVLEEAGVRFMALGGTSAGAINAAIIAAVRPSPDEVSWLDTAKVGVLWQLSYAPDITRVRETNGGNPMV